MLPILAATLLTDEPCVIRRVPNLSDVKFMGQILQSLGAQVTVDGDTVRVHAHKIRGVGDYDLIRKMRGSICILGPLLGPTVAHRPWCRCPAVASSARAHRPCNFRKALKSLGDENQN